LVLLAGFFDGFSKFRLFIVENSILIRLFGVLYENYSMRWEHTRNDFIAGSAYAETFSWLAELMQKCLKVEYLGQIEYDFKKSRVTGP
jgi:hypothetical protein